MNAGEDEEGMPEGDEIVAAEYVLGVLSADERAEAARRAETEQAFNRLVDWWEARLGPLASAYPAVEPPAAVREALQRRLFERGGVKARPGFAAGLAFWRGLALAALAAFAIAVAIPLLNPPSAPAPLVAALGAKGSDVHYVAVYDPRRGDVGLSHVSGERGAQKDFELWMIEGKDAPKSLGVVPVGSSVRVAVPPAMRARISQGIVFAISLEPAGGSPTGAPTGPVVAAGDLKSI